MLFAQSYDVRRNRMLKMRLRDTKRWTLTYRERVWRAALEEAHRRSFFETIIFAVTHLLHKTSLTEAG